MDKFLNLSVTTIIIAVIAGCSPAPMIQSPRVTSAFSVGVAAVMEERTTIDRNHLEETQNRIKEYLPWFEPYVVRFGIARRVELSGYLLPYLWHGLIGNINVKAHLLEHGSSGLFRNGAYALFGGASGYNGEWEDNSCYWVGCIAGTSTPLGKGELELVVQPSVHFWNHRSWNDNGVTYTGQIKGAQVAAGVLLSPFSRKILELNCGASWRYIHDNDWKRTADSVTVKSIDEITPGEWIVQGALIFHIVR
jgi:hypothetical protein